MMDGADADCALVPLLHGDGALVSVDVHGLRGPPGCLISPQGVQDRSLRDWLERFARMLELGRLRERDGQIEVFGPDEPPRPSMVTFGAPAVHSVLGTLLARWPPGSWRQGDSLVRHAARRLDGWRPLAAAALRDAEAVAVLDDRLRESGLEVPGFLLEAVLRAVVVADAGPR